MNKPIILAPKKLPVPIDDEQSVAADEMEEFLTLVSRINLETMKGHATHV